MSLIIDENFLRRFSRPFLESMALLFQSMFSEKILFHPPLFKKEITTLGDINALMSISGQIIRDKKLHDYKANLVLSWPFDSYLNVSNAMLMENYTKFCMAVNDVGPEIANMILGSVKGNLIDMGYTTDMSLPLLIEQKGKKIDFQSDVDIISIPVNCAFGNFFIEISYNEKPQNKN